MKQLILINAFVLLMPRNVSVAFAGFVSEDIFYHHKHIILVFLSFLLILLFLVIIYRKWIKNRDKILHNEFQILFDNMKEGFALHEIICDDQGKPVDYKFLEVNKAFEDMTGLSADDVKNKTVKDVLPNTEDFWIQKYGEVALNGTSMNFTHFSQTLDKHFNVSVYSPGLMKFATVFTDITEQVNAKEAILLEKKLLETILEDTLSGYWDWDLKNDIEYYSPSFKRMFGYEDWELENKPGTWQKLILKEDLPGVLEHFEQHFNSKGELPFYNEIRYQHKNSSIVWVICSGRVVEWSIENKPLRMVGCHIDITNIKNMEQTLTYLSYYDQLTGLSNRSVFDEELLKGDTESNLPYTIAMVDVNGLKLTNDAFGHLVGDELLKQVANILRKECRSEDIVARIGGDEFVLLLRKTNHEEAKDLIQHVYKAVAEVKLNNIVISVSIGWDTRLTTSQTMQETFIKAEEHMYRKKLTESQSMRNQTIQVILNTLNEKNEREKIHSEKVSKISRKIGELLNLDNQTLKEIEIAGLMHDIGKIVVNENLLNKPSKLTESEFEEIKRHPESSYHILKSVDAYTKLADYVLSHHERWDGDGYPRGLVAEEIPFISRIITIADAYEAMISDRPYRKGMSNEAACKELLKCAGTQFDPNIVATFLEFYNPKQEDAIA